VTEEETKNRVIVVITTTLCAFLLLSLLGTFILEWAGKETGTIWGRIFDLINVLTGALVGYVAGQQVERGRGAVVVGGPGGSRDAAGPDGAARGLAGPVADETAEGEPW
jgi:hypothetical protein